MKRGKRRTKSDLKYLNEQIRQILPAIAGVKTTFRSQSILCLLAKDDDDNGAICFPN